jgi:hypothetical protein
MNTHNPLSTLLGLIIIAMLIFSNGEIGFAQGPRIQIWGTDETNSYPVILGTADWVLIGTPLGDNFEKENFGKKSLEDLLLRSILQISSDVKPKVAVFSGGDSSDIMGMKKVMKNFVTAGYIHSFSLTPVSHFAPLDVSLYHLAQYSVVLLDSSISKGIDWQFIITESSQKVLARYLENGGKMVASALLFIHWNAYPSGQRMLYNEDLSDLLFDGARPDLNACSPRAVTKYPLAEGETILTMDAQTGSTGLKEPPSHCFWRLDPSNRR